MPYIYITPQPVLNPSIKTLGVSQVQPLQAYSWLGVAYALLIVYIRVIMTYFPLGAKPYKGSIIISL